MLLFEMIAACAAAALHVFIFYIESFAWTTRALSVFGMDRLSAEATRELAFNQGFYNLFLAVQTFCGVIALSTGFTATGGALTLAGTGSMLAAAAVLYLAAPEYRTAAVKQGTFPLAAVVLVSLGLMF